MHPIRTALLGATLALGASLSVSPHALAQDDTFEQLDLFSRVFERVREDYVREVEDKELVESAINGMLTNLDPHSVFLNAEAFSSMNIQTRGEYGGLGIEVTMENGIVKVVSPIDDTPAERAGIKAGDLVTHIDGEQILGMTLNDAVDRMRGPVGEDIVLTVVREGEDPFDVTITRENITISAVRSRLEGDVGVIRITTFSEQATSGLQEAVEEIKEEAAENDEEIKGWVLDLRNNPGGLLNQAVDVTDQFLERGEIVSTRGRHERDTRIATATPGDITDGAPLVVLINVGSASASEIVAGALKDHRRAIVMGEKSFGKGSVQTIIDVEPYGAIRMTTAYYYTPSGESIQATGIEPDIIVRPARITTEERGRTTREADLRGRLDNPNEETNSNANDNQAEQPEGTPPSALMGQEDQSEGEDLAVSDYQLARAIDLIRGLAIYERNRQE